MFAKFVLISFQLQLSVNLWMTPMLWHFNKVVPLACDGLLALFSHWLNCVSFMNWPLLFHHKYASRLSFKWSLSPCAMRHLFGIISSHVFTSVCLKVFMCKIVTLTLQNDHKSFILRRTTRKSGSMSVKIRGITNLDWLNMYKAE